MRGELINIQRRDECLWVVKLASPAACPIAAAECAAHCPTTWLGDGECDPGCNNEACGFDKGDCTGVDMAALTAGGKQCAPGCKPAWLGDKECDEECDSEACGHDGGDCVGMCAPGCMHSYLSDGTCDDECDTPSCEYDGGDCRARGRAPPKLRCSWGCPASWRGDDQCDLGCNVTACNYDDGDCGTVAASPPPPSAHARGRHQPPPPPRPQGAVKKAIEASATAAVRVGLWDEDGYTTLGGLYVVIVATVALVFCVCCVCCRIRRYCRSRSYSVGYVKVVPPVAFDEDDVDDAELTALNGDRYAL